MILESLLGINTSWFIGLMIVLISIIWLKSKMKRPYMEFNIPPFPVDPWLIIGHVLMLSRFREKLQEWRKKVGDIYSMELGGKLNICIHKYDVMKEIANKYSDCIVNTAQVFVGDILHENNKGIIMARDDNWREQRTTSLSILRSFGMGKNIMALKIQDEISIAIQKIMALKGQPTDLSKLFHSCISNITCAVTVGKRFDYDDPRLLDILNRATILNKYTVSTAVTNTIRPLKYIPGDIFNVKKWTKAAQDATEFARSNIKAIKKHLDDPDEADSFVSAYLNEILKLKGNGVETHLSEDNLVAIIRLLFTAGTESTSGTISWCLLYVLHNPAVQEKIYQEIEANIKTARLPSMSDKPYLVYLNAVIMETQRMASIVPIGILREVSSSFEVAGFTFPANSILWPVLDSVHSDEKIWGDPESFRPERFIDENGALINREELIPFGIGRRVCLGESLAKMELFLFLSALFQNFQFEPAKPGQVPSLKGNAGAVCLPLPYQIRAVARNE